MAAPQRGEGEVGLRQSILDYFGNGTSPLALGNVVQDRAFQIMLDVRDREGATCFHRAVKFGQVDILKPLLRFFTGENRLALMKAEDRVKLNAIFSSASRDTPEVFELLVNGFPEAQVAELVEGCCDGGVVSLVTKADEYNREKMIVSILKAVGWDMMRNCLTRERRKNEGKFSKILLHSMRSGNVAIVLSELPEEQAEFLLEYRGINGNTVIHEDAARKDSAVISLLNKRDFVRRVELLRMTNNAGMTPLHIAGDKGKKNACRLILDNLSSGQCQLVLTSEDSQGNTPLHLAAHGNHHETITELLTPLVKGQQQLLQLLEKRNRENNTAIDIAADEGHSESLGKILQFLAVKHRFTLLNTVSETETPVVKAVKKNHAAAAKVMLQSLATDSGDATLCIQLLKSKESTGDSVMHRILRGNTFLPMLKYLKNIVSPFELSDLLSLRNGNDQTPVHYAARYGIHRSLEEALLLLNSSQQFSVTALLDNKQQNPIHCATERGDYDVLQVLLNDLLPAGKLNLLDAKDEDGQTPEEKIDIPVQVAKFLQQCREKANRRLRENADLEGQVSSLQEKVGKLAEIQDTLLDADRRRQENADLEGQVKRLQEKVDELDDLAQKQSTLPVENQQEKGNKLDDVDKMQRPLHKNADSEGQERRLQEKVDELDDLAQKQSTLPVKNQQEEVGKLDDVAKIQRPAHDADRRRRENADSEGQEENQQEKVDKLDDVAKMQRSSHENADSEVQERSLQEKVDELDDLAKKQSTLPENADSESQVENQQEKGDKLDDLAKTPIISHENAYLESQVTSLQEKVDELDNLAKTQNKWFSLTIQVLTLENENHVLEKQLEVIEGKIKDHENQLTQCQEKLTLEERSRIESRLIRLEKCAKDLKDNIKMNRFKIETLLPKMEELYSDFTVRHRSTHSTSQNSENHHITKELYELLKTYINSEENTGWDLLKDINRLPSISFEDKIAAFSQVRGHTDDTIWHRVATDHEVILRNLFKNLEDSYGYLQECLWKTLKTKNQFGKTPIAAAVCSANPQFLQTVQKRGLSAWWLEVIQMSDNDGETVLHDAIKVGNLDAMNFFLDSLLCTPSESEDLLKQTNKDGQTPMHLAAVKSCVEAVSPAVNSVKPSEWEGILAVRDKNKHTAPYEAVIRGDAEMVKRLLFPLTSEQKLKIAISEGKLDNTLLFHAAHRGFDQCVENIFADLNPSQRYDLINVEDEQKGTTIHKLLPAMLESDEARHNCLRKIVDAFSPEEWYRLMLVTDEDGKKAIVGAESRRLTAARVALLATLTDQQRKHVLQPISRACTIM